MQVSVIIPVYNAVRFVEEAVQSALQQPETAEVILVDDGSTDGSYEVCQRLAQNPKIQLFTHPNHKNRRSGATRNLGLLHASSKFIAFLDADDYYLENCFAKTKEVFQKYPDADGTYGLLGIHYETDKGKALFNRQQKNIVSSYSLRSDTPPEKLFESFVLGDTTFSIDTLVLKKASFSPELLFAEHLFQGQDTDFKLKWIHKTKLYPASTKKAVTVYRIHDHNTTHNQIEACKFKLLTYQPWILKIRKNRWSKSTNRMLLRFLLSGVSCHPNQTLRKLKKIIYLISLLIQRPWLISKLV